MPIIRVEHPEWDVPTPICDVHGSTTLRWLPCDCESGRAIAAGGDRNYELPSCPRCGWEGGVFECERCTEDLAVPAALALYDSKKK